MIFEKKKIIKISLIIFGILLGIGLIIGGAILTWNAYVNSQPYNLIVKTYSGGVWTFTGSDYYFSVNTKYHAKKEISKSEYSTIKSEISNMSKDIQAQRILSENNIDFSDKENDTSVIAIKNYIFYCINDNEDTEYYKFNIDTQISEKVILNPNIQTIHQRTDLLKLVEIAVFDLYPDIIDKIYKMIEEDNHKLYITLFVNNDHIVFEINEQKNKGTSMNCLLYEYLPENSEAVFLINTDNKYVSEVIFSN